MNRKWFFRCQNHRRSPNLPGPGVFNSICHYVPWTQDTQNMRPVKPIPNSSEHESDMKQAMSSSCLRACGLPVKTRSSTEARATPTDSHGTQEGRQKKRKAWWFQRGRDKSLREWDVKIGSGLVIQPVLRVPCLSQMHPAKTQVGHGHSLTLLVVF